MTAPLSYDFSRTRTDEGDWADACEGYSFCQGPRCCKEMSDETRAHYERYKAVRFMETPSSERQDRYAEKLWREGAAPEGGQLYPRPHRRQTVGFWQALWRFLKSPVSGFFGD